MRRAILQALEDRYNAQISEADATGLKFIVEKLLLVLVSIHNILMNR